MRFHLRRTLEFVSIAIISLMVVYNIRIATTPLEADTDTSTVAIDSRLVAAVTLRTIGNVDGGNWTSLTSPAASVMTSLMPVNQQSSTLVPSFRQRGYTIHQSPALRVANFSPDVNEQHRERFVIRLSRKSSIWWWGSSVDGEKTTHAALDRPRDRVVEQISYKPASYIRLHDSDVGVSVRTIYVPGADIEPGRDKFISGQCPVDACSISTNPNDSTSSHMRLMLSVSSLFQPSSRVKPPGQIWVMYLLESPLSLPKFHHVDNLINWTATYRWDSTIVTPYAKFVSFPRTTSRSASTEYADAPAAKNYAAGKTKMVAWFVSNCYSKNERGSYVEELSRHVPVDVFGVCGKPTCPRSDQRCWQRLKRQYKFYLSFENSNCDYYITEKFFDNALG